MGMEEVTEKFMLMAERAFKARDEALSEIARLRAFVAAVDKYLDATEHGEELAVRVGLLAGIVVARALI